MLGRKITHLEMHHVAYAVAGDEYTDKFGIALLNALDAGAIDFGGAMERSLQSMMERKMEELRKKGDPGDPPIDRTVLALFYGPQVSGPQLWRLRIQRSPTANRVDGIEIAGGEGNATRFFGSYYQHNLPIRTLLPLASHIVLMGHRIDSLMVDGLDIATFDSDGFHFFDLDQNAALRDRSKRLDAMICRYLGLPEP